jgi:hypothetical protein
MRFLRTINLILGFITLFLLGFFITCLLCFPRLINLLADLFGINPGELTHILPALAIDAVLLILFSAWFVIPWRRSRSLEDGQGLIVQKGQGRAFMDTESVRQQIFAAVEKINNISRAEVAVVNDLGRAAVTLNILADNNIRGPQKKQEISREVSKVVQDQLGVQLAGAPIINISLEPIGKEVPQISPSMATEVSRPPSAERSYSTPAPTPVSSTVSSEPLASRRQLPPFPAAKPEPEPTPIMTPLPPPPVEISTPPVEESSSEASSYQPFTRRPFTPPTRDPLPDLPTPPANDETPKSTFSDASEVRVENLEESTPASDSSESSSTTTNDDDMPKFD